MSTKLYAATRIPGSIRPAAIVRELAGRTRQTHRQLVAEAAATLIHRSLLGRWPATFDKAVLTDGGGLLDAEFVLATDRAIRRASLAATREDSTLSLELTVAFADDPADTRWTYAQPFATNRRLREVWRTFPNVEPYPYWDNSDRPSAVTDAEWEHRRQIWNRVLPGPGIWAENGVSWTAPIPSVLDHIGNDREELQRRIATHLYRIELPAGPGESASSFRAAVNHR